MAQKQSSQKPPAKKPQVPVVKGTTQLAGDNGKINVAYTLGKIEPINITMTNARFSVVREIVGNMVVAPNKDEKLLIIDFIAHNPNPQTIRFDGNVVKFTAVDQESVNREGTRSITRAKTNEIFSAELKPAQKVELRTVIVVPSEGTVPKLMLQHMSGGNVLRYDLKPILKPLAAPYGDAKDETGMTATQFYECAPDTYYPMDSIDLKMVPGTLTKHGGKFAHNTVDETKAFISVKFMLKGQHPQPAFLRFSGNFIDENGEKYPMVKLAQVSTDDHVDRYLALGDEYAVRMVAVVAAKAKLVKLVLEDGTARGKSRTYTFSLVAPNSLLVQDIPPHELHYMLNPVYIL